MTDPQVPRTHADASDVAWRALVNSSYAVIEFAWPIGVALAITPIVVRGLGPSAFGVLSLVAVTLGMFGLLDLGIGGAAMRAVAQHVEQGDRDQAAKVLGTVVTTYLGLGLIGGGIIAIATPYLVSGLLSMPHALRPSASIAFYVSAIGFPVTLLVGAFASVPKAVQRFDLSTRVAILASTIGPGATVALVIGGYGLPAIAAASLVVNVVVGVVYYRIAIRLLGAKRLTLGVDLAVLGGLARFGGWFILASIGVTILYQVDKLLLGSLLNVAAVTYYVLPGGLANRIQGALGAATQVVFPVSSALFVHDRRDPLVRLYRSGTRLTFLLAGTMGIPMAIFAQPFLQFWLGPEFALRSAVVMVLLVGTYVILGLTGVAWGLAFGSGKANINALFTLGMGFLDVTLLLVLIGPYQIVGAAIAYLASAAIGVPALISYVERRVLGLTGFEFLVQYLRVLPAVAVQVALALVLRPLAVGLLPTILLMGATALTLPVLYLLLGLAPPEDRALLDRFIGHARHPHTPTLR